ncbi:MAG TPA: hypothetical protein RMF84_06975 [Polyangiaceae bacterium LLY-WYZ-14_1]|nr:hypothetical protein [Polyangiaceae bacterium LLY-WYZ-14_1]
MSSADSSGFGRAEVGAAFRERIPALLLRPDALLELFLGFNLAFLAVDIFVAHRLHHPVPWTAWIPFVFSLAAPAALGLAVWLRGAVAGSGRRGSAGRRERAAWWVGVAVGIASVGVGGLGLVLHLESRFFQELTLEGLVYSAPFSAPLAYTGLGLLVLMSRWLSPTEARQVAPWAGWVLVLAAGGFAGNFALSLVDHAQNGFFHAS